jgi:hypothetical protein
MQFLMSDFEQVKQSIEASSKKTLHSDHHTLSNLHLTFVKNEKAKYQLVEPYYMHGSNQ